MGIAVFFALVVAVLAIAANNQGGSIFGDSAASSTGKPSVRSKQQRAARLAKQQRREKRLGDRMNKALQREKTIQDYQNGTESRPSTVPADHASSTPPRSHLNDALKRGFGRS